MIANYHTHTVRCNHASGTEKEYIEKAIENKFKILGFSDHTPYFALPRDNYSTFRMKPELADDYFYTLDSLKKEYKNDIEILIGVEAEYYPLYFDDLIENFKRYPIEYMILGQHFMDNEIGARYNCNPTDKEELLVKYVDQVCTAIDTGRFTYIAHPDLFNFTGDGKIFDIHYRRLCTHAKEKNIPLEINLLGMGGGRHYPNESFFKIAAETGNQVILGCDAHNPGMLVPGRAYGMAMEMIERLDLNLIETVDVVNPKFD